MKRKWMFAAVLAGCMILTGCGASEKTETTEAASTEAATEETTTEAAVTEEAATEETTTEAAATEEAATGKETGEEETASDTATGTESAENPAETDDTETAEANETEADALSAETEEAADEDSSGDEENSTATLADETVSGWHIVVEDLRLDSSLENVSVELGYTGVETSSYEKEASEGNQFCLIKLLIEKDGSKEQIDWENLILTDADGTEYTRLDDEFIIDLGMMRMPGTSLNFGSNEGWIAFEVSETSETFTLSYAFEEETFSCELEG